MKPRCSFVVTGRIGLRSLVTVPVNPVANPFLAQAWFTNGGFRFNITGDAGPDYTVQPSTNLANWSSLFPTNSPTVPFSWLDAGATNFPAR